MDRPNDLKRVLADEIRAAIAETAPGPGGDAPEDPASQAARVALRRAEEVLTPSVPDGAPLSALKKLAIRGMRFLWRNQSSFNALSLSAGAGLSDGLDRLRAETEELTRRAGIQEARLTLAETRTAAAPAPGAAPPPTAAAPAPLPPGVYALFEERFRGSRGDIARAQRFYLDFLKELPGPVLDVGCGRGEFLELLAGAGIPGTGIESNPVSVESCRKAGLSVEEGDALERLASHPSGTLGAVVALQVVEHWPPETIFRFLQEARRALAPGGVLIAETINADAVSAMRAFYMDPTHVRPVPAETLRFLAEAAGLTDTRIEWRSPLPAAERLEERSENDRRLNALLFAAQDYALVARVPLLS
jgi:SAM-dependent methyltransferase